MHSIKISRSSTRIVKSGRRLNRATRAMPVLGAPSSTLSDGSGVKVAPIINGMWTLAGGHGTDVFDNADKVMNAAVASGFTSFDTADIYGMSQELIGDFYAGQKEAGNADNIQIFTKFVPNIFQQKVTPQLVEASVRRSAALLRTDRLDLVQMHWWDYSIPGMVDAAKALADLRARGLIKSVGMTNMDVSALDQMVKAGVPVSVNQVQFSLLDRRPLNGMVAYCREHNIKLFVYGSVGGGFLSDRFYAEPQKDLLGRLRYPPIDLNTSSLKMYSNVIKQNGGMEWYRELLSVLRKIADKHAVTIANVAVRWVIEAGEGTVHPIIGLRNESHFEDNARVFSFSLDTQDKAAIDAVLAKSKGPTGDAYSFERGN